MYNIDVYNQYSNTQLSTTTACMAIYDSICRSLCLVHQYQKHSKTRPFGSSMVSKFQGNVLAHVPVRTILNCHICDVYTDTFVCIYAVIMYIARNSSHGSAFDLFGLEQGLWREGATSALSLGISAGLTRTANPTTDPQEPRFLALPWMNLKDVTSFAQISFVSLRCVWQIWFLPGPKRCYLGFLGLQALGVRDQQVNIPDIPETLPDPMQRKACVPRRLRDLGVCEGSVASPNGWLAWALGKRHLPKRRYASIELHSPQGRTELPKQEDENGLFDAAH